MEKFSPKRELHGQCLKPHGPGRSERDLGNPQCAVQHGSGAGEGDLHGEWRDPLRPV